MKTFVHTAKALFVGVLLFSGVASSAQTTRPFDAVMYPAMNSQKLQVNVAKNDAKSKVYIQLLDKNDQILLTRFLPRKANIYQQRFDMSDLQDGVYRIRVSSGSEVIERSFQMKSPSLQEQLTPRLLTIAEPVSLPVGQ